MHDSDVRDERLAELLEKAVRSVQPVQSAEGVIRRGDWRRGLRFAASIVTVVAFVSGAILAAAIVRSGSEKPACDLLKFDSAKAVHRDAL